MNNICFRKHITRAPKCQGWVQLFPWHYSSILGRKIMFTKHALVFLWVKWCGFTSIILCSDIATANNVCSHVPFVWWWRCPWLILTTIQLPKRFTSRLTIESSSLHTSDPDFWGLNSPFSVQTRVFPDTGTSSWSIYCIADFDMFWITMTSLPELI